MNHLIKEKILIQVSFKISTPLVGVVDSYTLTFYNFNGSKLFYKTMESISCWRNIFCKTPSS